MQPTSAKLGHPFITVVSGLPRSGTSLMMQMLAAGGVPALSDGQRRADEDNPRGYFELEATKRTRTDASWLLRATGHAVKVIHVHLRDLPLEGHHYRVLLMQRELREVLSSQRTMLERRGESYDPSQDALFERVFRQQLAEVSAWLQHQPTMRSMLVDFKLLLESPRLLAEGVARFLELPLDLDAMELAVDPSLHRQRSDRRELAGQDLRL